MARGGGGWYGAYLSTSLLSFGVLLGRGERIPYFLVRSVIPSPWEVKVVLVQLQLYILGSEKIDKCGFISHMFYSCMRMCTFLNFIYLFFCFTQLSMFISPGATKYCTHISPSCLLCYDNFGEQFFFECFFRCFVSFLLHLHNHSYLFKGNGISHCSN